MLLEDTDTLSVFQHTPYAITSLADGGIHNHCRPAVLADLAVRPKWTVQRR